MAYIIMYVAGDWMMSTLVPRLPQLSLVPRPLPWWTSRGLGMRPLLTLNRLGQQ